MLHGNDTAPTVRAATRAPSCRHPWCPGLYCADSSTNEAFHYALFGAEGDTETVGVELICNDHADGTSTGPLVDITWSGQSVEGLVEFSASLTPEQALRHAAEVAKAAGLALASRAL